MSHPDLPSEAPTAPVTSATQPGRWLLALGRDAAAYPLPSSGRLVMGRSRSADLVLDDATVSRHHAALELGETLILEDLESANGVRVGARRLRPRERVHLRPGEPFVLGKLVVVVQGGSAVLVPERPTPTARRMEGLAGADATALLPADAILVDPAMMSVMSLVARIADAKINVLVQGETGVGKELVADALHRGSSRRDQRLVKITCGALNPTLVEAELFGFEKGSFSGAHEAKAGLLELADGGTVLFDEIGDLPPALQPKLLRILQERRLMRVGGLEERTVDLRFVATTRRDLQAEVMEGRFRPDLLYRLNGMTVTVPPLRERPEDIRAMADAFVERTSKELGLGPRRLDASVYPALAAHRWPGNVRELRHAIAHAVMQTPDHQVRVEHLPAEVLARDSRPSGLKEELVDLERQRIVDALKACGGNQTKAAAMLGMPRRTFLNRLTQYQIERPRKRQD